MSDQPQSAADSSVQNFDAVDEETLTKIQPLRSKISHFMITQRKRIFFLYLFVGIILFYLLITKPHLRDPYLIEIFNR